MEFETLVADIGGTKSDVAIAVPCAHGVVLEGQRRFRNDDFSDPLDLFALFTEESALRPQRACFAIAGPVDNRRVRLTNRDWSIDADRFEKKLGLHLMMINDLTAVAASIAVLPEHALRTLQQGQKGDDPLCAVLAPGTGLGEGFLLHRDELFFARGGEGGHCSFAPHGNEQEQLLRWARRELDHVCGESFLCGSGIVRLYRFAVEELGLPAASGVVVEEGGDSAPAITAAAAAGCPACGCAVRLFLEILGSEAGNLALKLLAKGGVYLGGGILPKLHRDLDFSIFLDAFRAKGAMSWLMETFPVSLIVAADATLRGCACCARRLR